MKERVWKTYLRDFSDFLPKIALVLVGLFLMAVPLNVFTGNSVFVAVNGSLAIFILCSYLLRKRLGTWIVLVSMIVSGFTLTVVSLLISARLGSAEMTFVVMQLFCIIFLPRRQSIAIAGAGILIFLFIGWLYSQGTIVIPQPAIDRQTNFSSWILAAITLFAFSIFAITLIGQMRTRLLNSVEELIVQNHTISQIAFIDAVTGLENKSGFLKKIQQQVDQRQCDFGLIILFEIRKYSHTEVLYGITVAEAQLKAMAQILEEYMEDQFVARINGGEFAIWSPHVTTDTFASTFMDKRIAALASLELQAPDVPMEIDKSVARFPEDGATIEECLLNAELALHDISQHGRDIKWFSPSIRESLLCAEIIENNVEKAISEDEFRFVFQPQVEFSNDNVVGIEVLARWSNQELGTVNPVDFIPALTRKALITRFTIHCLRSVLAQIEKINSQFGPDISISFNISPAALLSDNFVSSAVSIIRESSVDPKRVIFEITEDLFIEELEIVESIINNLSQNGIRVSIDDFGTGYSCLSYISALPISEIKADKSFVCTIAHERRSFNVFQTICSMADALGFNLVAEGVENVDQLKAIQKTSCRIIQGHLLGRPEPLL